MITIYKGNSLWLIIPGLVLLVLFAQQMFSISDPGGFGAKIIAAFLFFLFITAFVMFLVNISITVLAFKHILTGSFKVIDLLHIGSLIFVVLILFSHRYSIDSEKDLSHAISTNDIEYVKSRVKNSNDR